MPITIPAFVQYQAPMFPLRALWNTAPAEGDRFISCEIDWGQTVPIQTPAVQIALSGNSPLNFSQIVALSVDNARCGSDVQFIFTDSGFVLIVPAYTQGVFPVFTNALMFYVVCSDAAADDMTAFQILNSMPPPVQIATSQEQQNNVALGVQLDTNGATQVIPASVLGGTITALTVSFAGEVTATESCILSLVDGTGRTLGAWQLTLSPGMSTQTISLTGLHIRFFNGVQAVVSGTTITVSSAAVVNLFYGIP